MSGALMTLLSIRATGELGVVDGDSTGALQTAGRVFAYAAAIGAGSIIGVILGVIIALFSGFVEVC